MVSCGTNMESSAGSETGDKPWDHAWSTEEMRKHRKEWSLAGDAGLLNHLEQFSENLTKRANETQKSLDAMVSEMTETSIIVDNIINASLALANTQFIESRVQEDNVEIEKPEEPIPKDESDNDLSATDLLLASVYESISEGIRIMEEKYEKVEVLASDSEDDDNAMPSVILRPKDPYRDRPLPYVFDSEEWKSSTKVGLESSSSESDQNEDEDSANDTDEKNVGSILNSNIRTNLRVGRLSSTSSGSNDYNIESSSIKDNENSRLHTRSQDTLNSDTEPTTPSSALPKTQHTNNGPPSFAEELAKRLGSVLPSQRNVVVQDSSEQVVNRTEDDIFSKDDEQDVFNNKTDNLFSQGKNLFSDVPSTSWKNKPARPVNKNIIPASIDVPPPLTTISSAPKSTIDDLFGDADDSEDSDDIFSSKASKDIFSSKKEAIRSEVLNKPNVDHLKPSDDVTTSTPLTKNENVFSDMYNDLFYSDTKQSKPSEISSITSERSTGEEASSLITSATSSEMINQVSTGQIEGNLTDNVISVSSASGNISLPNADSVSSSGVSVREDWLDTYGSSLDSEIQPAFTSSQRRSASIFREPVTSDSLLSGIAEPRQQSHQDATGGSEDVFLPPPSQDSTGGSKSKIAFLFDDSDSGDDLFASPSSTQRTPSKLPTEKKKKNLFDEEDDLFGPQDSPEVDLFGASAPLEKPKSNPVNSLFGESSKTALGNKGKGLFEDTTDLFSSGSSSSNILERNIDSSGSLFNESKKNPSKPKPSKLSIFDDSDEDDLFGGSKPKMEPKSEPKLERKPEPKPEPEPELETDRSKTNIDEKDEKNSLFDKDNAGEDEDDDDDDDLFGDKKKKKKKEEEKVERVDQVKPEPMSIPQAKQKLEKEQVDGAVSSKKAPPKTLKIPKPEDQQGVKKPVVSDKIKALMGIVGNAKQYSPTDTPPLWRKNNEDKSVEDEQVADLGSETSEASLPSVGSSPHTSGTNSRARDSPSLKSENIEVAVSFDEPAQVETLTSIASSKSRAKIPTKRRPQSRQARHSALRHSGIDFDIVDASSDQPNSDRAVPTKPTPESGHTDDRSEFSASRNTTTNLLSPSTDEEDLFDVPPDLPEDPAVKEESLFGRAPILSPVETHVEPETEVNEGNGSKIEEEGKKEDGKSDSWDPLRDKTYDPLNDPSQLFAFVTKTPSPDKSLLVEDDESLFSNSSKPLESKSIPPLDLFGEDEDTIGNDLFSSSTKKLLKDTKIDPFEKPIVADDEDDDDLFGTAAKKINKKETEEKPPIIDKVPETTIKKTASKGIFDDEEDIFVSSKKTIAKKKTTSLFDDDDDDVDDDDIFGTSKSLSKAVADTDRPVVKKAVTRDLKKTAETIVKDPLTLLQDD